jgi:hypothetical protein
MKRRISIAIVGLAAISATLAFAQSSKDKKPGSTPPGMSEADMQACMEAAKPGPQHAFLVQSAGVWQGKSKMWMTPDSEPETNDCTTTITPMMDGKFTKCEMEGQMSMGPFSGFGLYGYDNVAQEFQSTWISNCGTGMMTGTGQQSSDGKTLTWKYEHNCPIAKKPVTMREVERITGKDSKTLEVFGPDPKTGQEFKMMEITFTRKPGSNASAGATTR